MIRVSAFSDVSEVFFRTVSEHWFRDDRRLMVLTTLNEHHKLCEFQWNGKIIYSVGGVPIGGLSKVLSSAVTVISQ